jgi:hypothetical protein
MLDQAHNLRRLAKDNGGLSRENRKTLNLGARLTDTTRRVLSRIGVAIWRKHAKFNVRLAEATAKPEEKDFTTLHG